VLALATALVGAVTFASAWMGDDPFITFRVLDNAFHGFGLTWNPFERVQVFTHPLWALVLLALRPITREFYLTALYLSIALAMAVVVTIGVAARSRPLWLPVVVAALFMASKAYIDYSTSGLENPLTHFLVALFYARLLFDEPEPTWTETRLATQMGIGFLVYINRADALLAVVPGMLHSLVGSRRMGARALRAVCVGSAPAVAWTLFSLVYYGFPFPNTAYAKLNAGNMMPWFHPNGFSYFQNSLKVDPVTLPFIGLALVFGSVLAWRQATNRRALLPLAGAASYLVYTLRIGGDYMSGRLFALPLLLAVLGVAPLLATRRPALGLALAATVVSLLGPRPPLTSIGAYPALGVDPTGIRDERGDYYPARGLTRLLRRDENPSVTAHDLDPSKRGEVPQAVIWGAIGGHGFFRGPEWYTIDDLGLSDALLARLPGRGVTRAWGRGHLWRDVPAGYIESVEMQENRIVDPSLHAYFDQLSLVTTGPLWRWDRFRAIWALNSGGAVHLLEEYAKRTNTPP
jgi:arabinofuranosyltransferase